MTETWAVPSEVIDRGAMKTPGNPLCPACKEGRLQPYMVTFSFAPEGWQGTTGIVGWVAICEGNAGYIRREIEFYDSSLADEVPPCGFSMQMGRVQNG